MDVHIGFFEQSEVDAELWRARLHQRQGRLRTLLHHLTELTGKNELAAPEHPRRLDKKDIAAGRRPGEASRHARHAGAHGDLPLKPRRAENKEKVSRLYWLPVTRYLRKPVFI